MPGRNGRAKPRYKQLDGPKAWHDCQPTLERLVDDHRFRDVCDVGGGANPVLPIDFVESRGLSCVVLDVSGEELAKTPAGYHKLRADICAADLGLEGEFDLVFSRMVAEHMADPERFHGNIHRMLRPGGIAFHFFPTLYALPFVVNRLVPDRITGALLDVFAPRDKVRSAKFPAFYAWCRGPTRRQFERFEALGYRVLDYIGCFGHGYYERIPLARALHESFASFLVRHPAAHLTSYAYVVLQKSGGGTPPR